MSKLSELRLHVIRRDQECVAAKLDRSHSCRDKWGDPHAPEDMPKLTLEHVKLDGVRFDDSLHCVALCAQANVQEHWSSPPENNRLANAYLLGISAGMGLYRQVVGGYDEGG